MALHPFDGYELTIDYAGVPVFVEVSPCSLMHKGYGLQIRLALRNPAPNIASCFDVDKATDPRKMKTREELLAAAQAQALRYLARHGLAQVGYAVDCWVHFVAKEMVEDKHAETAANKALAKAKAKAEGYTHRVTAVIHPKSGGDDYAVQALYRHEPTQQDLATLLSASAIKDDYLVEVL